MWGLGMLKIDFFSVWLPVELCYLWSFRWAFVVLYLWVVAIIMKEGSEWTRLETTATIHRSMLYIRPRKELYQSNTKVTQEQRSLTRGIITFNSLRERNVFRNNWNGVNFLPIEGFRVKTWSWINFNFRFPTIMSGLKMPQNVDTYSILYTI